MIQLSYQPALDPFHTVFRCIRLQQSVLAGRSLELDHVKILDFYLLFPFRCGEIRLLPSHRRFKSISKKYAHTQPYGGLPDSRMTYGRMSPIQRAALDTMAKNNFIDVEPYRGGFVKPSATELPSELRESARHQNETEADLIEFLSVLATEYQLLGENGLKHRSGLMEHIYDAA